MKIKISDMLDNAAEIIETEGNYSVPVNSRRVKEIVFQRIHRSRKIGVKQRCIAGLIAILGVSAILVGAKTFFQPAGIIGTNQEDVLRPQEGITIDEDSMSNYQTKMDVQTNLILPENLYDNGIPIPLTEIHILRESKIKFTILLLAHHCIWDKSSSLIFNELIEDSLSLENYMPDNGRYSDYVMKINQTDKKLFNMYDEWPLKRVVKSQNVRLSISNGKEKEFLANPWKIVEEIIYSIGKSNGLLMDNKLLLYVVQDDRTYFEKDTAMLIGQCLDLMPVEMDMEKIGSLEESIKCLQSKKALYNLNYISLSSMNADRIREMFSSVLILNFQGQYEMSLYVRGDHALSWKDQPASPGAY